MTDTRPLSTDSLARLCQQHRDGRPLDADQLDQLVDAAIVLIQMMHRSREALDRAVKAWAPLRDELNMVHSMMFARTSHPFDSRPFAKRDRR